MKAKPKPLQERTLQELLETLKEKGGGREGLEIVKEIEKKVKSLPNAAPKR